MEKPACLYRLRVNKCLQICIQCQMYLKVLIVKWFIFCSIHLCCVDQYLVMSQNNLMQLRLNQGNKKGSGKCEYGQRSVGPDQEIKLYDVSALDQYKLLYLILERQSHGRFLDARCIVFDPFKQQSKYDFGYKPLLYQVLPDDYSVKSNDNISIVEMHQKVKAFRAPNFLGGGAPVHSQLNVQVARILAGLLRSAADTAT